MYLPAPSPRPLCSPKMYGDGYEMGEPAALPAWHLRPALHLPCCPAAPAGRGTQASAKTACKRFLPLPHTLIFFSVRR